MTHQFTSNEIKSNLSQLCALRPDLGLGGPPQWLRLDCNTLAEDRNGDTETIFNIIGVEVANIVSTFKSKWIIQFHETKSLHEGFDDEFPDRGFDVKVFNKIKFVAMRGPGYNKAPNEGNIIKKGSKEAATITTKFKAHFGYNISSAPTDECPTGIRTRLRAQEEYSCDNHTNHRKRRRPGQLGLEFSVS